MRIRIHASCFLLALAGFLSAPAAHAAPRGAVPREAAAAVPPLPNPVALSKLSEEQLKRAYIACDAHANGEKLSTIEAAQCAMMHRELVERVFGGEMSLFDAWWEANKSPASKNELPLGAPAKPVDKPEPAEQNDKLQLLDDPGVPSLAPDPVAAIDQEAMRQEQSNGR